MKKFTVTIIALLVAGLWLMPVQRTSAQADIEKEMEKIEREIRDAEELAGRYARGLERLTPDSPDYEERLGYAEKSIKRLEEKLNWLRTRLADLSSRIPSTPLPDEDPKSKKMREKFKELEEKRKQLQERVKRLLNARKPRQPAPGFKAETTSTGGLTTTTFTTPQGRIIAYLPDDMRAGDTISGTVVAEPNGQTAEERARNLEALNGYQLKIANETFAKPWGLFTLDWWKQLKKGEGKKTGEGESPAEPSKRPEGVEMVEPGSNVDMEVELISPIAQPVGVRQRIPITERSTESPIKSESSPNKIELPTIGQQGRPLEIPGPFDGNASNTTLDFKPVSGSGGSGPIRPLAESPRKCVFESPTNFTGPVEVTLKEGDVETKGTYRNVGVRLSAPKTNLMRGEKTTVTVEVIGLEGITTDVPLQLQSQGVVNMEGGNTQHLQIRPQDVKSDGRYTTTRAITGQQAGSFSVTATVVVEPSTAVSAR